MPEVKTSILPQSFRGFKLIMIDDVSCNGFAGKQNAVQTW